nr:AbrB/MazE/SpoVT family DNA-binding domain-containing protein [Polycladomyces sp. WAk]
MGNSLGIGIPKEIVEKLNIQPGDEFEVSADPSTGVITIRPVKKITLGEGLTPEMREELKDILKRYENTFRNLKDR